MINNHQLGIILAAGEGSRLAPFNQIAPKALMPIVKDKWFNRGLLSIIEYQILQLKLAGIKEVIIVLNYKKEVIKSYLGDGQNYQVTLKYLEQKKLQGNGQAFFLAKEKYITKKTKKAVVLDCDNYFANPLAIKNALTFFLKNSSDVTVGVSQVKNHKKFAIFKVLKSSSHHKKVIDIIEKPQKKIGDNLAKSGLMILGEKALAFNKEIAITSNAKKEIYTTTAMIRFFLKNHNIKINLYPFKKTFSDIGTWDEYLPLLKKNI